MVARLVPLRLVAEQGEMKTLPEMCRMAAVQDQAAMALVDRPIPHLEAERLEGLEAQGEVETVREARLVDRDEDPRADPQGTQ